jgi:hypothetical protein
MIYLLKHVLLIILQQSANRVPQLEGPLTNSEFFWGGLRNNLTADSAIKVKNINIYI